MSQSTRKPSAEARRVALLVETSLAPGRGILRGISRFAREHDSWSVHHEPRDLEEGFPSWLKWVQPEGIIVRLHTARLRDAIARTGVPAVDVLGEFPHPDIPLVHVDDVATAELAAQHLLDRGFRHFGAAGIRDVNWSERRTAAFAAFVGKAGHACDVLHLDLRRASRRAWNHEHAQLSAWIASLPKPCGVMASGDLLGTRVLQACHSAAVMLPDQVAVIGASNDEVLCEMANPPLSSVTSNHMMIGYEAAALLERMMQGERPPKRPLLIDPSGVATRQSTDALAVDDPDTVAAIRFIRQHACGPLTIDDVVEAICLSRSTLKRRFRDLLGRSVHDEIVRVRIVRAQELLSETSLSIAQIAARVGFAHPEYFSSVFRSVTGKTPRQYREAYLK